MKVKLIINRFVIPEADGVEVPINVNIISTLDPTGIVDLEKQITQLKSAFDKMISTPKGRVGTFAGDYFSTKPLEKYESTYENLRKSARDSLENYQPRRETVGDLFSQNTQFAAGMNTDMFDTVLHRFQDIEQEMPKVTSDFLKLTPTLETIGDKMQNTFKADYVEDLKTQAREATAHYQYMNDELGKTSGKAEQAGNGLQNLSKLIKTSILVQIQALAHTLKRVFGFLEESFTAAGDYVESMNLYTMSVGQYAEEGKRWAKEISDALYLDESEIYQYTGQFFNLTRGLGASAQAADLMSRNLTQLSYDMASYLNIDVSVANNKLMSAMSGQTKAVTSVGVAVQSASLQELAYSLNIEKSVQEMTQAEKTYLRYIQIMRSTSQMQGDLGRTIITPTNAMRLLRTQMNLLARSIGQVVTPLIMELIPVVIALTQVLTELAQAWAKAWGYKIEDYLAPANDVKVLADNFGDLDKAAKGAGKSIQRTLAPFDELNVVETSSKGRGAGGLGADSVLSDLEQYLDGYDMLEFYTDKMKNKIENMKKLIKTLGPIIAAAFAVGAIAKFISKLLKVKDGFTALSKTKLGTALGKVIDNFKKGVKESGSLAGGFKNVWAQTSTLTKALVGAGGLVVGMTLAFKGMENLGKGSKDTGKNLLEFGGGIAAAAAGGAALGSIIPGVGTAVGALGGALVGAISGLFGFASGADKLETQLAKQALFGDLVVSTDSFKKMLDDLTDNSITKVNPRLEELSTTIQNTKESFDDSLQSVENYLYTFSLMGDRISNEDGVKFTDALSIMFENANAIIDASNEESLLTMTDMLNNTVSLSDEAQKNLIQAVTENGEYRKTKVQEIESSVYDIYNKAIAERGYLTKEEKKQIQDLLKQIDELTTRAVTQTEANLLLSQENFNTDSLELAEESYDNFLKARDAYEKEQEAAAKKQYAKDLTNARSVANEQLFILKDNNKNMAAEIQSLWDLRAKGDTEGYNKGLEALKKNNEGVANELQRIWKLREDGEKGALESYHLKQEEYKKVIQTATDNIVKDLSKKYKDLGTETEGMVAKERQILGNLISKFDPKVFNELHMQFLKEANIIGHDTGRELFESTQSYLNQNKVTIKGRAVLESMQGGTVNFTTRASGGFPDTGEFFVAREDGPELVGTIGHKTAVANNDQITAAMTNAMIAALSNANTGNNKPTQNIIYIGNKKVFDGMSDYVDSENDRYGTNYIRV